MPCAVLSVEKRADGGCGDIRIQRVNRAYRDLMGPKYYDGMLYQELVPKEAKFEDFCFRAAYLGQHLHSYVEARQLNVWTDMQLIPMALESETLGLCQFLVEFTAKADPERMAGVSANAAEMAVKASLILLAAQDFREGVAAVVDDLVAYSGADLGRILLVDDQKRTVKNYVRRLGKDSKMGDAVRDSVITYEVAATWKSMVSETNVIIVKNQADMDALARRNGLWAETLRAYAVKTLSLIPFTQGGRIFAYLYIVNFDADRMVAMKEMMELLSFILGAQISNRLLLDQLEEMSSTDALTGVNNRNAMIRRVKALTDRGDPVPFGVVNIDLNGLKTVNDNEGHDAGDRLLIQAAELITSNFRREDVYRTGGDEFIILSEDVSPEVFRRKVNRLRESMENHAAVSFALGTCWTDGGMSVKEALAQADEIMYANKKAYYAAHPEQRRR